jgi:hypothetical protein
MLYHWVSYSHATCVLLEPLPVQKQPLCSVKEEEKRDAAPIKGNTQSWLSWFTGPQYAPSGDTNRTTGDDPALRASFLSAVLSIRGMLSTLSCAARAKTELSSLEYAVEEAQQAQTTVVSAHAALFGNDYLKEVRVNGLLVIVHFNTC